MNKTRKASTPAKRRARRDTLLASAMLLRLAEGADIRARKARRLRAAIRVDAYENELKLQLAADRLLDAMSELPITLRRRG